MKKWPLYILLFLVVVQKNNFEKWIASGQIIYKKIHQNILHHSQNRQEHSITLVLSKEAFQEAHKEEHELYLQERWYDIQSIQSQEGDSVLVICQVDDWDTYLAEWLHILDESNSNDSKDYPVHSKLAKSWSFEQIVIITCGIESSTNPQIHFVSVRTLMPEIPWIKMSTPPPLFN